MKMKFRGIKMMGSKTKCFFVLQIIIVGLSFFCSGCASTGYMGNRMRDAEDVFTASVGFGAGAKARVGPIQVGLMANIDMLGLRGGQCGDIVWYETLTREIVTPFPYKMQSFMEKEYPWDYPAFAFGNDRYHVGDNRSMVARRGKTYEAVSPIPFVTLAGQPEYYTQIEVVVGLLGSLRLGFNPGELLDFSLGWTTLDIYHDDLKQEEAKPRMVSTHNVGAVSSE